MHAVISTRGGREDKDNGRKVPKTPPSGRVWKKGKMSDMGDNDLVMESGGGGGGKSGNDVKNGGGKDLTMVMTGEKMKEMQNMITALTTKLDKLKMEKKILKEAKTHIHNQDNHDSGGWGRREEGTWKDDEGQVTDEWKRWTGKDEARKQDGGVG